MTEAVDPTTGEIISLPLQSEFWTAFCKFQMTMEAPKKTKTAKVRPREGAGYEYQYAPLEEIIATAKKPLGENSLVFQQAIVEANGQPFVSTRLVHAPTGQFTVSVYPIFAGQNPTSQAFGSGVTYARRYSLLLALGMAAEEDDDGAASQERTSPPDRSQQQQRRPSINPPTQQANGQSGGAREAVQRVRAAIAKAETVDQLNKAYTRADETLIKAQGEAGARIWDDILGREADKRVEITAPEGPLDALDEYLEEEDAGNALR